MRIAHMTLWVRWAKKELFSSLGVRRRRPSSVVCRPSSVVRRKLFQKSSPLKVLDQWKPNLVWIITRVSSFKIVSGDAVLCRSWYAAHFCNLKLTFISYSFWNIRQKALKFYKFDEKRAITPRWVIRFTDGKLKLQTCSACQDLPTLQFWSKFDYQSWSYCLFFFFILILFVLYFKN
jgi:hypothetical protein